MHCNTVSIHVPNRGKHMPLDFICAQRTDIDSKHVHNTKCPGPLCCHGGRKSLCVKVLNVLLCKLLALVIVSTSRVEAERSYPSLSRMSHQLHVHHVSRYLAVRDCTLPCSVDEFY